MKIPQAVFYPFWFWNGEQNESEIVRQLDEIADSGCRGYALHSRKGNWIPYLSDRWLDLVKFACEESRKRDLKVWIYDEDGFPSGNAVSASRAEYRQFGFALNNDGEKTFAQWRGNFAKEPDFSVVRKGMLTVYEVRIPWSELNFKPDPGNVFDLSVLVNDNDGRARKVLLEWGGGIHGMRGKPMNPLILK